MMQGFWQRFGKVIRFGDVLSAANIWISDLPMIGQHVENRGGNRLCFNHILGHCPHMARGRCTFIHVMGTELTNDFVVDLCRLVTPAVESIANDGNGDNNDNNRGDRGGDGAM